MDLNRILQIALKDAAKFTEQYIQQQEGQRLPDQTEMKRLLKSSQKNKFIDSNVAVSSAVFGSKTVKCWVFENGMEG